MEASLVDIADSDHDSIWDLWDLASLRSIDDDDSKEEASLVDIADSDSVWDASLIHSIAEASASAITSDRHQLYERIGCFSNYAQTPGFCLNSLDRNVVDLLASYCGVFSICLTGEGSRDGELSNVAVDDLSGRTAVYNEIRPLCLVLYAERVRSLEERKEAGSFLRFLRALATSCTCLFLQDVHFQSDEELSALCEGLASPRCKVKDLYISSEIKVLTSSVSDASCWEAAWPRMTELLLENSTSLTTEILYNVCLLKCTYHHPASKISPHGHPHHQNLRPDHHQPRQLRVFINWDAKKDLFLRIQSGLWEAFPYNIPSSLADILLGLSKPFNSTRSCAAAETLLCQMLVRNASLTSLTFQGSELSGQAVRELFTSLESNLNLNYLSLAGCHGPDWPSITCVLDSIRINSIITQLDLEGTPFDSQSNKAAVEIQLAKNRANVKSLKVLQSEGNTHATRLVQPTSVRFFLCGFPYSGKTTLSASLAHYWTEPSTHYFSYRNYISHALGRSPKRTQGIEVTNLEKDGMKFSIWDLAGQKEYCSFHDYMLPSFAEKATPTIFLFVWCPIAVDKDTGRHLKDNKNNVLERKSVDSFCQDFKYWLRFIASKTLKSKKFRPRVFVAITRADKTRQTGSTKDWLVDIFHSIQKEFEDYLDLDMDGVFEIDARYPDAVQQLALYVVGAAKNLLKSVLPIYRACDEAGRLVNEMVNIRPLMAKDEFFRLCQRRLGTSTLEVLEAIANTLNNSGDLIYFKSSSLVVVDVKWFGHHIMGRLLHSSMTSMNFHHKRGVWPLQCLKALLDKEANVNSAHGKIWNSIRDAFSMSKDMQRRKLVAEGEDLANILIELGLACQLQDGEPGIFIPTSLHTNEQHRIPIEPCNYLTGDRQSIKTYMGRRLRCKDAICTFFTPGFFPALQVKFRDLFSSTGTNGSEPVTLVADVIAFACEGVEVFMEFCRPEGEGQFIDILVQSHKDLDGTIKWIHDRVLENVEQYNVCVCACVQDKLSRRSAVAPGHLRHAQLQGKQTNA